MHSRELLAMIMAKSEPNETEAARGRGLPRCQLLVVQYPFNFHFHAWGESVARQYLSFYLMLPLHCLTVEELQLFILNKCTYM